MDEKTKLIIIIALAVVLAASVFFNLQTYSSKKTIEQELKYSKTENASLAKKIEEIGKDNKRFQEQVNTLNSDLNKIIQEKEGIQEQKSALQKKYDSLVKEKNRLLEKIKTFSKEAQKDPASGIAENYWAEILKTKTELELQLKDIQASSEQLKSEKGSLEMELSNLAHEKQDLEQEVQSQRKVIDDMASGFVQEKNIRFQLQDKLTAFKSENAVLRRQLSSLTTAKAKIEKTLSALNAEKSGLERKLTEMELFLKERLSSLNEEEQQSEAAASAALLSGSQIQNQKKESIELPPIVVSGQTERQASQGGQPPGVLRSGKVLTINKENSFVIVDLGEDTGLAVGDELKVFRASQEIATIEVIQTRRDISACDIKEEAVSIKIGDIVR